MNPFRHFSAAGVSLRRRLTQSILSHRVRIRNPTLICHPTAIWDYGYSDIDVIRLGQNVRVAAFTEIIVYKRAQHSSIAGSLSCGDNVTISTGANIRAAGGAIEIGDHTIIGQHAVLLASTHRIAHGSTYQNTPWDESKSGVTIGRNCWIGANVIIMPGITVGDNSIVGAGSTVTKDIPPNEVWGGVPSRLIRPL